ncbi:MAG: class I SAM-dependent methyltransferase [Candidatus Omnitrophica bacterium]|nr:class I SAM-dependent methyltransferase [Candidatus Omnitrophota bacterium]
MIRRYVRYLTGSLLDIGCGTRPFKELLSVSSYLSIDWSECVAPDVVAKCEQIPFKEARFDSVICTELLEHLRQPEECLLEIKRVLKPGGFVYITVPQSWCLHYEPHDYWRFTKYGIEHILKKSGFNVLDIERIGGIFSLIGVRLTDVFWNALADGLSFINRRWAERVASLFCAPLSLIFYCLSKAWDTLGDKDVLGWAVIARR